MRYLTTVPEISVVDKYSGPFYYYLLASNILDLSLHVCWSQHRVGRFSVWAKPLKEEVKDRVWPTL